MQPVTDQTETIGRLAHLLTHVTVQLPGLISGKDTFEDIRQRYAQAMNVVAARGQGRVTAPRVGVGATYRYWTSVRDLIKELQVLTWLDNGVPVPSTKETVDSYRDQRYPLTDAGRRAAELVADRGRLADALTDAALAAHPYLRGLLDTLSRNPTFCPEVAEGLVQRAPSRRHWAEHAANLWRRSDPAMLTDVDAIDTNLAEALRRRFGRRRAEGIKPSPKELAEAMNDAFADIALRARGLNFGATTLDQLKNWAMELRLLDQSRYVQGHTGGNFIWLTCDMARDTDDRLHARRRTFTEHGVAVGKALVAAFMELRDQLDEAGQRSKRDYLPIHVVRALAAFRTGTARELGDRALEAMASADLDLGFRVRLLAARFEVPPRSEPMYQRGGTRALMMTMTAATGNDT